MDTGGGRAVARDARARGRRRARTAVVNGNNCCGRCHSKARVPNARCQTVVRVITVITWYRARARARARYTRGVCAVVHRRGNQRNGLALALHSHPTATHRAIVRFVIDSRLERALAVESVATIGKRGAARGQGRHGSGLPDPRQNERRMGGKYRSGAARLAGVFLKSLVLSETLVVRDGRI